MFTTIGEATQAGGWQLRNSGRSLRYATIAALGLQCLPEAEQRTVLAGHTAEDLVGLLAKKLDDITGVGDAALVCWAAAAAGHSELPHAVTRLGQLDGRLAPVDVVSAAWVVSALVAARRPGRRGRAPGRGAAGGCSPRRARAPTRTSSAGAPRGTARTSGSFADQVYPVQALARLHHSSADPEALATANTIARVICGAQGAGGQWWWHYDSRTGGVVEGYPVYTVHQHAMAPMALLDLADAGGDTHLDEVCRGLRWLAGPPEARRAAGARRTADHLAEGGPG